MRRISWKSGMRLTDDIMRNADDCSAEIMTKAFLLSCAGRFGLLPATRERPFRVDLNIMDGYLEVTAIDCQAITRGGSLIDIKFDTHNGCPYDTRVALPDTTGIGELILTVGVPKDNRWELTGDGYEEPVYTFALIGVDSNVPDNALPIARIVDEHGWRMDESDFVPPCLFLSSHWNYEESHRRFADMLAAIDTKAREVLSPDNADVIRTFWPLVQQVRITIDKEYDTMTPTMLLSCIEKCVSAFICACDLIIDGSLQLDDAKMFRSYVMASYNYRNVYQRIQAGLQLCFSISEKVAKLESIEPERPQPRRTDPSHPAPPTIPSNACHQECTTSDTVIPIVCLQPAATVYFTTNGTTPTVGSQRAVKSKNGQSVKFDNGFRKEKGKEPDRTVTLQMISVADGVSSSVVSFTITLHKSLKFINAIPI